jgi:hypothetical protein
MLTAVRAWILLSTLLVGSGWILSVIHELNRAGYVTIFALATAGTIVWRRKVGRASQKQTPGFRRRLLRRFRRPAPLFFLLLVSACFVAGAIYPVVNSDTNSYRIPRVLHWLNAGHWHWIHTLDVRENIVGCGYEWLTAPLMLFSSSDRFNFLINVASYALLPGLVFSVFTRLQVRPRVAWWWMWILSAAWCYVLQSGSTVNDALAAVYALASVDLALRARESRRIADLWLSMLAVGLATGVKQTVIPLAALWLIAAWPSLGLALARLKTTALIGAVSLLVSIAPLTCLNIKYCGNWQGLARGLPNTWINGSPLWRVVGNVFCISVQNLALPFCPWSGSWNRMIQRFLETPFGSHFAFFERFGHVNAGVSDTYAGLGLGHCVLILISLLAARAFGRDRSPEILTGQDRFLFLLRVTPWLLLLVFMAELTTFENARLLAPYYPFLLPFLLGGPRQARLVNRRWWQTLALCSMILAGAVLVTSRDRPLFPAQTVTTMLKSARPQSGFLSKLWSAYRWRSNPEVVEQFARKHLTRTVGTIGYATFNGDWEPLLSYPFGSRRVERVVPEDSDETLRQKGIDYVFIDHLYLEYEVHESIDRWIAEHHASLVDSLAFDFTLGNAVTATGHAYLIHLNYPVTDRNSGK